MTDSTSNSMRLNSSKHDQAPAEAKPLKNCTQTPLNYLAIFFKTLSFTAIVTCCKYLAHGNVVETIGAVEDNTLYSEGFCQILRSFRLACTSRTFGGSVEIEVKCTHQRTIATIGQRSNDQPAYKHRTQLSIVL